MVATLQLEVAKRLMAKPGTPDYGVLTLLVQLDYEPQSWFKIPASCFFPEPDVDSACVCLARREQALLAPAARDTFARIVKRSFSQRRKMMLKLLKRGLARAALGQGVRAPEVVAANPRGGSFRWSSSRKWHKPCSGARHEEEMFDVVNERDEVIGQQTRSEVHRLGLMHRAVHVLGVQRGRAGVSAEAVNEEGSAARACGIRPPRATWIAARITTPAQCGSCARRSGCS